jgi:hypothetical protein
MRGSSAKDIGIMHLGYLAIASQLLIEGASYLPTSPRLARCPSMSSRQF